MSVTPTPAQYFKDNKYVLLQSVLTKDFCDELTKHMFKLYDEGQMVKDQQCPLSDSVYGDPVLDGLLEKLAEPVGHHLGIKLLPTYTYARIYRPGEVLEKHKDRPACEISGTMTLGFDGSKVWPIYFSDDERDENGKRIDLALGDLLMYRGEELIHWRPAFKGQWQCQVFFHFVDAEGPHAAEKYDGRPSLGLSADTRGKPLDEVMEELPKPVEAVEALQRRPYYGDHMPQKQSADAVFPIFGGVMIPSWDLRIPSLLTVNRNTHPNFAFSDEECQAIIDFARNDYADFGSIGTGQDGIVDKSVRNVHLYRIPLTDESRWVFDKIARVVSMANAEYFDYEIMGITHELQLLHYESGTDPGHYNWHADVGDLVSSTRKISVSIQLSDPTQYRGGQLKVNVHGRDITADSSRGTINMFPSYSLHQVTPMEHGERWALVIWVHGSRRFR